MTFTKKLLASSVLVALSSSAFAGLEGNYGVTSDYIWRGASLSNHGPAVFGGVDWSNDSGVSAGIWNSSEGAAGATNETDFYAGYDFKAGAVDLGVGFIAYKYLSKPSADFNEIYLTAGFGAIGAGVYIDSSNKNNYMTFSTEVSGFGLELGIADLDGDTSDYNHFNVSYSLNDNVSMMFYTASGDGAATDPSGLNISYSTSFDM